jgi:dTDP-4-dehydrorhamnose reductase
MPAQAVAYGNGGRGRLCLDPMQTRSRKPTVERIVITGANGQLGAELDRRLGPSAIAVTRRELDLEDTAAIAERLRKFRPGAVINCAAYTAVDRAEAEPQQCYAVNALAVERLAAFCAEEDVPLVQISTNYVFGSPPEVRCPWSEDQVPFPRGVYAHSKRLGEQAAARAGRFLVIRTCGLYARPEHVGARNFVQSILERARRGETLHVVADQYCTPSYVPHVAQAVIELLEAAMRQRAAWGVYHVTNEGETTWFRFAQRIVQLSGMRVPLVPIPTAAYASAAPRPIYGVLDTTKCRTAIGHRLPTWQAALQERLGASTQRSLPVRRAG